MMNSTRIEEIQKACAYPESRRAPLAYADGDVQMPSVVCAKCRTFYDDPDPEAEDFQDVCGECEEAIRLQQQAFHLLPILPPV